MPVIDVQKIMEDGYRLVKFNEVNDEDSLRGKIIQTLVEQKYYSNLKLDGGQLSFKRRCRGNFCDNPTSIFALIAGEYSADELASQPEYAIMTGRQTYLFNSKIR